MIDNTQKPEDILNPEEKTYLIKKAELLKTSYQISKIANSLIEDLCNAARLNEPQSNMVRGIPGKDLKIEIPLDKLTVERFEMVIPYFKGHLEEYHELRDRQRELEESIKKGICPEAFEVIEKGKNIN